MYLDSIGNCTVDGLQVTPRLSRHESGFPATFSASHIAAFLQTFSVPNLDTDELQQLMARTQSIFSWNMAVGQEERAYQISILDLGLFAEFPSNVQIRAFNQIIDTFTSIPGYLTSCDITHGNGSANQCVRVLSPLSDARHDYYVMCEVPGVEEVLACVFHIGEDVDGETGSYFLGSYECCRRRGDGTRAAVLPLLMN
ncbi:Hypothetical predicted protein [Olea europaea subsp. europaea]|uniref:Uncharacterized protein n=1 Tax=Olea europaea subsp. europaea TaxID=158383 RepID=A0A8S0RCR0_OLEEU|nr:Hypothetical predicted protein [Olea europaea subsp. europaea]